MIFLLCFLTSPHLWSIKELGIQALTRRLFSDVSLSSSGSTGFPSKVVFFASAPHLLDLLVYRVVSRVSLDSVTSTVIPHTCEPQIGTCLSTINWHLPRTLPVTEQQGHLLTASVKIEPCATAAVERQHPLRESRVEWSTPCYRDSGGTGL